MWTTVCFLGTAVARLQYTRGIKGGGDKLFAVALPIACGTKISFRGATNQTSLVFPIFPSNIRNTHLFVLLVMA